MCRDERMTALANAGFCDCVVHLDRDLKLLEDGGAFPIKAAVELA